VAEGIVTSQIGLFWEEQYKKEKIEELKELIQEMEKADDSELIELVPKAIYTLLRLYDWATAGELSDSELLADLVAEVIKEHMKLDQDEVEDFIEELEHQLK